MFAAGLLDLNPCFTAKLRIAHRDPALTTRDVGLGDKDLFPGRCDTKTKTRKLAVKEEMVLPGDGSLIYKRLSQTPGH
jgi:hypothetical protein